MAMTSNLWNNVGENTVTSSLKTGNASRVATRCVMECRQMGGCVSVALDPASGTCRLQPTFRPARQGDTGPPLRVYVIEKVAGCRPSQAPNVANARVTKWQVTSSSLDGDVSCDEDYVLSTEDTPRVRCQLNSGAWSTLMTATCKQFAWRNYTVQQHPVVYSLPRPAKVGLCVRVKGAPTSDVKFMVNLRGRGDDIVLHTNPRLGSGRWIKTTVINSRVGTSWSGKEAKLKDPNPPFPFAVGATFEMDIIAVSLYKFRIKVNGVHYADYTGVLPVTDVSRVSGSGSVSIENLIIGC